MNEFEAIGVQLRQAREARELTLQQVEKKTHIRVKYLQAIEYGDFNAVDMPLQLRGFLRNYALEVGLDPDQIQTQFEHAVQGQQKGRRRKKSNEQSQLAISEVAPSVAKTYSTTYDADRQLISLPRSNTVKLLVTMLIIFGLIGAIVGGIVIAVNDLTSDNENPSDDSIITVDTRVTTTPLPTPTTVSTQIPTPNSTPIINPGDGLQMTVSSEQRLWIRVVIDGQTENPRYEGILRPDEGFTVSAIESITIRTSNAVGLQIVINNQEYSLGNTRVEVERTFSISGISTPTPLPGATATVSFTPTLTDTPLASITATRTNTPTQALDNETSPTSATLLFTDIPEGSPPTSIPMFDAATNTVTVSLTSEQPTIVPTFTPSPFLPPRETRTPIVNK